MELQGKPLTPQIIAAAAAKAAEETDPVEILTASAEYKRHVATVYARKAIEAAVERAEKLKTVLVIVTRVRNASGSIIPIREHEPRTRSRF